MITILTPTYNRAYIINKAYESLLNQTNKDFEWIIVDDGSTDYTEELINKYIKANKIKITYIKKENGGKHTALNIGFKKSKGSMLLILDSDDFLSNDAVETILKYEKKYKDEKDICGFSFSKLNLNGNKIGKKPAYNEIKSNHIDFRYNKNNYGDMAEVFYTDILKKYEFPIFGNEIFLSEAIVWNKIALNYNTIYINKGIYFADYISDGLSKNYLKLVYKNPIGASENAKILQTSKFNIKLRIKNTILYIGYSLTAKKKNIIKNSNNKILTFILFPLGILFKIYLHIFISKKNY